MKIFTLCAGAVLLLNVASLSAQDAMTEQVTRHLLTENPNFANTILTTTDRYTTRHNGVEHVYMKQTVQGIEVFNSNLSAVFGADGVLINVFHNFLPETASLTGATSPTMSLEAVSSLVIGAEHAGIHTAVSSTSEGKWLLTVSGPEGFEHVSKADLVYFLTAEEELKLAWIFDAELPAAKNWYQYIASAENGALLKRINWTVSCTYDHIHTGTCSANENVSNAILFEEELEEVTDGTSYRIFPFPVESPNHGNRSLLAEPAIAVASPFGWHDINGVPGPEYLITRGNNVHAYEDINDVNEPGTSPNGGPTLTFDHSLDLDQTPDTYTDAAITNLFYANNRIHDHLYYFGFDEVAGNFQTNNYDNGGEDDDWVRAEAQDGGGSNNANMATPPDGSNPRMQMYLWTSGGEDLSLLTVNSPSSIDGPYQSSSAAGFGPALPGGGITADVVVVLDGSGSTLGCSPLTNAAQVNGKIAIVDRGSCPFVDKVQFAQEAGAVAVIVANNTTGVIEMGGSSSSIDIPSIMISQANGNTIKNTLNDGQTVNATLNGGPTGASFKDGSFDNGIIIHEYVHGLSNRLTGGPSEAGCLGNEEQMGEGWSDWYATMMTMNMDAANPVYRPMGTYASSQSVSGTGIRPAPYDTSFAVNNYTYANLPNGNISTPHGVGFIWCTMLWDLTWALMDQYGYDAELDNPDAGNNIAMLLVTDALKLQVCEPGFEDGRDAILLADEINYGGANQCLIWEVFAKRGLGFSASQGSSQSKIDGVAAFDVPTTCLVATSPPVAAFAVSAELTCNGIVFFTDQSTDTPQFWLWDFGDGNTSMEQNPVHQYESTGSYEVSLTVTNNMGEDTYELDAPVVFEIPEAPVSNDAEVCAANEILLIAQVSGSGDAAWYAEDGTFLGLGSPFAYTMGSDDATLQVTELYDYEPEQYVGPLDNSFGIGANHATQFVGTVNFTVSDAVVVRSAWVVSSGPGVRTINLWSGDSGVGELLAQTDVDIDFAGGGRIDLNFDIDLPGTYSIGLNNAGLYRNNGGVSYPYVSELMTITGSSAGPELYYYFYDIEVQKQFCESEPTEVQVMLLGNATFTYTDNDLEVNFVSGPNGSANATWDFGDGNTDTGLNPTHIYTVAGEYTVTHTTEDGCSYSMQVLVGSVGIQDADESEFKAWPNPTAGTLFIEPSGNNHTGLVKVTLYNMAGKAVAKASFNGMEEQWEMDLSSLASGMYMLDVVNVEGLSLYQSRVAVSK